MRIDTFKTPTRSLTIKQRFSMAYEIIKVGISAAEIKRVLKRHGFVVSPNVQVIESAIAMIKNGRHARIRRRLESRFDDKALIQKLAQTQIAQQNVQGHQRATPKTDDEILKERLARLDASKKQRIIKYAKDALRYGAAGGTSFAVTLTTDQSDASYQVVIYKNWNTYKGAYKGWAAKEDHHKICAPADWKTRVESRGLAMVDGKLTLNLDPIGCDRVGVEMFRACYVQQGRGYNALSVKGFIARVIPDGETYAVHGDTEAQAISKLRRQGVLPAPVKQKRVQDNNRISVAIAA